jgi:phage shock protein PspC (stress-responsive transcriptional regulator)
MTMDLADQLQKLQNLHEQGGLTPEEFTLAKKRVLDAAASQELPRSVAAKTPSALHEFRRSITDKWFGGVCGGLAKLSSIPAWSWRILFLLTVLLHGIGLLFYVLLWIFVPIEKYVVQLAAEKLD